MKLKIKLFYLLVLLFVLTVSTLAQNIYEKPANIQSRMASSENSAGEKAAPEREAFDTSKEGKFARSVN